MIDRHFEGNPTEDTNMSTIETSKISPFLWFDSNAHEAIQFYCSIFKNSHIIDLNPMVSTFVLEGQRLMALNGGPVFSFTPAISLYVNCEDQVEVDILWGKLSEGGEIMQCGWVKDRFGLCWQVIPKALGELMSDPDPEKSGRVMQAMLRMKKIEVEELRKAHNGLD